MINKARLLVLGMTWAIILVKSTIVLVSMYYHQNLCVRS